MRYLLSLLFIRWPSHSFICQLLHPRFSSCSAFKAWSKLRVCCRYAGVPGAAFDCLDASSTPYLHISQRLHLSDNILWYLLITWLWLWKKLPLVGCLTDEVTVGAVNKVSVFYCSTVSDCVIKNTGCRQTFLRSLESSGSSGLCMISLTVQQNLSLGILLWLLVKVVADVDG